MACYRPLSLEQGLVPCGQCDGCRLEYSRQWAVRCMHEASLYEQNAFVTCTYDEKSLPSDRGLDRKVFPAVVRALRKELAVHGPLQLDCPGRKVRYFHAGEYGDTNRRPHYHSLLFGLDFPDKVPWSVRDGLPVYRSALLERFWPYGQSVVGDVTYESAAYVARYCLKKSGVFSPDYEYVNLETGEVQYVEREYATMSRRPGIGAGWFDKFGAEAFRHDSVVVSAREQKPPRYYLERLPEAERERVRAARAASVKPLENTRERLAVREKFAKSVMSLKRREL